MTAIRAAVSSIQHPACVADQFNAMDERDVVALYPLDRAHFDVSPGIENERDVRNHTANRHGISGYLDAPVVAARLFDAVTA